MAARQDICHFILLKTMLIQIPNLSDTKLIRYQTCQIPNLPDTEFSNTNNLSLRAGRGRGDWSLPVLSPILPQEAPGGLAVIVSWEEEREHGLTCLVPNFATGCATMGWWSSWAGRGREDQGWPVWLLILPQEMVGGVGGQLRIEGRGGY